jgi:hypothetical protein
MDKIDLPRPWPQGSAPNHIGYDKLVAKLDEIVDRLNETEEVLKHVKLKMDEEKAADFSRQLKGE